MKRNTSGSQLKVGGAPLAQRSYEAIRDAIERGDVAPGDRISEYRIADWLQISRTPARESLLRLESEGILTHHPRRGLVVASHDDESLKELFQAREVLEASVASFAALNASGPQIDAINRLVEVEPGLIDDKKAMYDHNKDFHAEIRKAAHNRYLGKFSSSIHDIVSADRRGSSLLNPARRKAVLKEHRAIADAISRRDAAAAEEAAREHIRNAYATRIAGPQAAADESSTKG